MSEIFCNRCFRSSISADGIACFYCGSYGTRRVFPSSLHPPLPKPDTACAKYYYTPAADALTENVVEGSMLLDQAGIPTKGIEINSYVPANQWHPQEISIKNDCLPVNKTCNTFDPDWNFVLANAHRNGDENNSFNAHKAATIPSSQILNKLSDNSMIKDPNVDAFKSKILPEDNFHVVSGPSGLQEKEKMSQTCEEKLQSKKSSETQSLVSRDERTNTFKVCNENISHPPHNEEIVYKCCFCTYETSVQRKWQLHSFRYQPKKICNICQKEYVGVSHNDKRTCGVCKKIFVCRTQLNEHNLDLDHRDHFDTHCWGCCDLIKNHLYIRDEMTIFVCCVCGYESNFEYELSSHNSVHRPNLYCKICKEEYDPEERTLHGSVNTCFECRVRFECKSQLEDHLVGHNIGCLTLCSLCESKIGEHLHTPEEKTFFKCCLCMDKVVKTKFNFIQHLFAHSRLRLFKCEGCKKRFGRKYYLKSHSKKCSNLPFKCEICEVSFPFNESVDVHRFEKHF